MDGDLADERVGGLGVVARRWVASAALALLCAGCAPKQVIPLDVHPAAAALYVDGEAVEGAAGQIELRSDRDHKLFFKHEGYRPEMVVLRSSEIGQEPRLEPRQVRVRLVPLQGPAEGDLTIEFED